MIRKLVRKTLLIILMMILTMLELQL